MQIGDAIKSIRKEKKIKQNQLSDLCKISQTYLSQIENNKKTPNIELLKKIGECLDIPIPVILFLSLTEDDVSTEKKELFKIMNPTISKIINDIFITN